MSRKIRDVKPSTGSRKGRGALSRLLAVAGAAGLFILGFVGAQLVLGAASDSVPEEGTLTAGEPAKEAADGPAVEPAEERAKEAAEHSVPDPPEVVSVDTLRPGSSLGAMLRARGFSGDEFLEMLRLVEEYESPRRLRPGTVLQVSARIPERISRVTLDLDRDRDLHLFPGADGWSARLDSVPVRVDTVRLGGVVRTSLWEARFFGERDRLISYDGYNQRIETILELSRIYAWQVDFFRDIRRGDAFRLVVEREVRPDGTVRSARVLAAEFVNRGRSLSAIRFDVPGEGPEYFDDEGEATRKAFLRAPLEFGRVTSGFSRRRYHPVLRQNRPHLGIDYGAPAGTPVMATGAGVVTRAGRWGGYGIMVELRHGSRYRTRYAHMRGLARGIRPGVRVEQGQVVGYVGSTGLSTAPHLHYEFLVHGTQRDPRRVDLPPGDPVPAELRDVFRKVAESRLDLLAEVRFPSEVEFDPVRRYAQPALDDSWTGDPGVEFR